MASKPKFLKNILTTASALAVLAGAGNALAVVRETAGGGASIATGANFDGGGAAAVIDGSSIRIKNGGDSVLLDRANFNILTIDTFAAAANPGVVVSQSGALGSINKTYPLRLSINAPNNNVLTLSGNADLLSGIVANDYSGLTSINFIAGNNSVVKISVGDNTIFNTAFIYTNGLNNTIEIDSNNLVMNGNFGANGALISKLKINDNKSATINVDAGFINDIKLGNNSTLTMGFYAGSGNSAKLIGTGVDGTAANSGTLNFAGKTGAANPTFMEGKIGAVNGIAALNIKNTALEFKGGVIKALKTTFQNANSILNITTADAKITGNIVVTGNNEGVINLVNKDLIIDGQLAGADKVLKAINVTGDQNLTFTGGDGNLYVSNITTAVNNQGIVHLSNGAVQNIRGNIGTAGVAGGAPVKFKLVNLDGAIFNVPMAGAYVAATTNLNTGFNIYAMDLDLAPGDRAIQNTLVLLGNNTVDANIIANNLNNGNLNVSGDATVTGNIGRNAAGVDNSINALTYVTANNLTVGGTVINAKSIAFGANAGTLTLSNVTDNVTINALITATNAGTIDASKNIAGKTVEFTGAIGDKNNALSNINAGAGILVLSNDAYVTKITMDKAVDSTIKLNKAGGSYAFELAHETGFGTLEIAHNAILTNSLKLGSDDKNLLKAVKLDGDIEVTIDDNVNLYATNFVNDANKGSLTFLGDATVSASQNAANPFNTIKASNVVGKTVTFTGKQYVNNVQSSTSNLVFTGGASILKQLNIVDGAVVEFGADSSVQEIIANNKGTIKLNNGNTDENSIIKFNNATDGGAIGTLEVAGGNVELSGKTLVAQTYKFSNANRNSTVTLNGIDVGSSKAAFTTAAGQNNVYHNIKVNVDQNFNSAFGTAANPFGSVIVDGDKTVTITTDQFFAGVESVKEDQVTVVLSAPTGATGKTINLNQAGSYATAIKELDINENANVGYVANAGVIKLAKDKTVTFTAATIDKSDQDEAATLVKSLHTSNSYSEAIDVPSTTFLLSGTSGLDMGANTTVNFDANSIVNSNINATVASNGTVNFKENAYVNNLMGSANNSLAAVNFATSKDSLTALNSDIYAKNINASNGNFFIVNPTSHGVVFNGTTTLANQNIYLDNNDLFFAGNTTMTGNISLQTALVNGELGTITVQGNNNKLDLSGVTAGSTVVVSGVKGTQGGSYDFIVATNGASLNVPTANFNLVADKTSRRFGFTLDNQSDPSKVKITSNYVGAQGDIDAINKASPDRDKRLGAAVDNVLRAVVGSTNNPSTGDAAKLSTLLSNVSTAKLEEAGKRLASLDAQTHSQTIFQDFTGINKEVGRNMVAITNSYGNSLAGEGNLTTAAAAGDNDKSYNLSLIPYYNHQDQKTRHGVAGYKGKSFGAMLIAGLNPNDTAFVGVAGSVVNNETKHKDYKFGDKTKSTTYAFTVYGTQQLSNNWFYQGLATIGNSSVHASQLRVSGESSYEIAKANYNATIMSGELLTGYNIKETNMFMATPIVGVRYSRYSPEGHKEKGTSYQNLIVTSGSVDKFEATGGLRVAGAATDLGGLMIVPEAHGFVDYSIKQNNGKQTASLNGAVSDFGAVRSNPGKFQFNGGLGAAAKTQLGLDVAGAFDMFKGKKFKSYQISFKMGFNF